MKKNMLKKTIVFVAVAIGVALFSYANDGRVPIKSKRQLEYPSLPQGKKNCRTIAEENHRLYWQKKGILNNPKWISAEAILVCRYFKTADKFIDALYEWMDKDDNAALAPTLLTPRGHAVAVDSIFKEEKRYLMVICSWGEKFVIEIPRPVQWIKEEGRGNMITGCRVVGGDPKKGRYLYDESSGAEKGWNQVTIQIGGISTMIPVEVAKRDTELFLKCFNLGIPMPEDQVHPFVRLFLPQSPASGIFPLGMMPAKYMLPTQRTKENLKKYNANYAKIKEYNKKSAAGTLNKGSATIPDSPVELEEKKEPDPDPIPATNVVVAENNKNNMRTVLFSEVCKFKVTEEQFKSMVAIYKKHGINLIDDRKKSK